VTSSPPSGSQATAQLTASALPLNSPTSGSLGQQLVVAEAVVEVILETVGVAPGLVFTRQVVGERDRQARAQHRLGPQDVLQAPEREARDFEVGRVRPKPQAGAGVALPHGADVGQLTALLAVFKGDLVAPAAALDGHLQAPGKGVDHRHPHPVQTAGEGVVLVGELGAGVQAGQNQLHPADPLLRVDVHRHAAAVVADLQRAVGVQPDLDPVGKAGDGFVDAVVDDLLAEVVGAFGVGVHPRPALDRRQAPQDLDGFGRVAFLAHEPFSFPQKKMNKE
jgi:hypothetical protein